MKTDAKRKMLPVLIILLFVVPIAVGFGIYRVGKNIGTDAGIAAGKAVGSFEGVTSGLAKGSSDGKEKGLSADDTQAVIKEMKASGKFRVLRADLKLDNLHTIGEDYVALYKEDGYAIYTVDLQEAVITVNEDGSGIVITVPEPEVQLNWNAESLKELAHYQKYSFTGSAEEGLQAFKNSFMKTDEEVWKRLGNYETLMEQARDSAKKQIQALAVSVRSTPGTVEIQFKGEGGEK